MAAEEPSGKGTPDAWHEFINRYPVVERELWRQELYDEYEVGYATHPVYVRNLVETDANYLKKVTELKADLVKFIQTAVGEDDGA